MKNTIKHWCADNSDPRAYIREPFIFEGKVCATNGHILIATNESDGDSYEPCSPHLERILKERLPEIDSAVKFIPIESVDTTIKSFTIDADCEECDGLKYLTFENEFNKYEIDCLTCDGKGTQPKIRNYTQLLGLRFNADYIEKLRALNNLEVCALKDKIAFKSKEGVGLLMSIRDTDNEE